MRSVYFFVLITWILSGCTQTNLPHTYDIGPCPNEKTYTEVYSNLKSIIIENGENVSIDAQFPDYLIRSYTQENTHFSLLPGQEIINIVDETGWGYTLHEVGGKIVLTNNTRSEDLSHEKDHLCNKVMDIMEF